MLSVVITAWNEEANLPRVVSSVKKLADEIVVVVDTASTDKTAQIAEELGCQVYLHEHTGIVEPMRNFSTSKASGDWILLLDADEEIPQSLVPQIKKAVSDNKIDYYRLPRKNMIFNKWIRSSHWWPDYVYRLFRKNAVTWDDTIHSVPFTRGKGADFPAQEESSIIHHHYTSISQYVDRLNRYTDHQVTHLLKDGYNFSWTDLINKPTSEFFSQYFARGGFKEGLHGLALAGLQAFSELVLYLKLWQNSDFVPTNIDRNQLYAEFRKQSKAYRWWHYESFNTLLSRIKRKLGV